MHCNIQLPNHADFRMKEYRKQLINTTTYQKGDIIMKKTLILITALITVGFLATHAFSWGPGTGRGMDGYGTGANCPGMDRNAYTDLSDDQKQELTTLRQKFIDDTYELRVAMMQKHNEARLLMETSQPDRAELSRLNTEISDLMKQVQESRIDFMLATKKVAPELRLGQGMGQKSHQRYSKGNCPKTGQGYGQKKGDGTGRY